MSNKMIIDASHPEETRVVVLRGNRVEDFDFESADKKPLRGNIYLAKVTRVEPSLQAAFIEYGGNRHGFLAFSEIHPDYYQIPVADRQALLEEEARSHREEEEEPERRSRRRHRRAEPARSHGHEQVSEAAAPTLSENDESHEGHEESGDIPFVAEESETPDEVIAEASATAEGASGENTEDGFASVDSDESVEEMAPRVELGLRPLDDGETADEVGPSVEIEAQAHRDEAAEEHADEEDDEEDSGIVTIGGGDGEEAPRAPRARGGEEEGEPVEMVGGDAMDETPRRASRPRRHYKIQEVIKRRQVLLVQVVKEERGNKGAALTTYLSLAGRYSVLMPNTARGGGISRKITSAQDRSRLKEIADELDVPDGMGVILRTAGASRTKQEVRRDFEYLLRMWETVRETTLSSSAPTLVYEEGSLIKRAIRDLYSKEIDEIVVAGDAGYREAKDFMRLLMPGASNAVVPYRDPQPLFAKAGVEAQLDAMFSNQVTLKSGGYIVINQTEALVAIDVNSGRSTREHNIEDTAVRTNLEAADEVARQLRLRDLAGLIVVDFIDMEEGRNNRSVERRMKEALKNDRARIQVGRISHFGLLEMSRQRIRTGVLEGSTVPCSHCAGAGVVRSTSSLALHVLRVLEDTLIRSAQYDVTLRARTAVALYILNHKRAHLRDLETRFGVRILVEADETLAHGVNHALERGEPARGVRVETPPAARPGYGAMPEEDFVAEESPEVEEEEPIEEEGAEEETSEGGAPLSAEETERRGRRRRRRRRGGAERGEPALADAPQPADDGLTVMAEIGGDFAGAGAEGSAGPGGVRRRRSRRGRRDRGPRFGETGTSEVYGEADNAPAVAEDAELLHGDSALGGVESSAGMDEPAHSIAEALEPASWSASAAPAHETPVVHDDAPKVEAEAPKAEVAPAPEPAHVEPEPEPEPAADEPPRPRRTGWWQRAKSTLVGE
jgi:ribonuclease E